MMTNSRFSNKSSLAKRVLLLAFFLVVLPLLIYGIILFYEDVTLFTAIPEEDAWKVSREKLFFHLSLLFALIFVVGGFLTWWITKRMARPLKMLTRAMERVGEGHLSTRYEKDLLGFEINLLGEQFNQMVANLVRYIEEIRQEKIMKEIFRNELKIGHEIQKQIFPQEIPTVPGFDIGVSFHPALEISGDFYDLFAQGSSLILTLGDASGKGIPASLYALLLRSFLRAGFYRGEESLSKVVEEANALFCKDTRDSGFFSTAWVGKIDLDTHVLHYLSCGHLPALLVRQSGEIVELATRGIAFGAQEEIQLVSKTCTLVEGDLLVIYSDGFIEAHDPEQNMFGQTRLTEAILEVK
ncbi:MAG: PP2C family protein-serine/threonine phosphatase, partial [Chlamydiales bacterium]